MIRSQYNNCRLLNDNSMWFQLKKSEYSSICMETQLWSQSAAKHFFIVQQRQNHNCWKVFPRPCVKNGLNHSFSIHFHLIDRTNKTICLNMKSVHKLSANLIGVKVRKFFQVQTVTNFFTTHHFLSGRVWRSLLFLNDLVIYLLSFNL